MRQLAAISLLTFVLVACGTNPPKVAPTVSARKDSVKTVPPSEEIMWKITNYAGQLGDSKNASYITNTYAIWGTYHRQEVDNSELKVKFLIDKVSFCVKLYEYGQKVVNKGDENAYKIVVKSGTNDELSFSAQNISDRIFINESEARKIVDLFEKGERVTFSLTSDSKTSPASYAFSIDHPRGLRETMEKLSK